MAKIGYILKTEENDTFCNYVERMDDYGCVRVMVENQEDEKLRPLWKQLMALLATGDELVLAKMSNAVRSTLDLSNLIEICRVKRVRLISIGDKIDSAGTMFPMTSIMDVLTMVGTLPEEVEVLRQQKKHIEIIRNAAVARKARVICKDDREQTIVNMYQQGFAMDDIWRASRFRSKSSVFRILNKHGVPLTRGKTHGPRDKNKKNTEQQ